MKRLRVTTLIAFGIFASQSTADDLGWRPPPQSTPAPLTQVPSAPANESAGWQTAKKTRPEAPETKGAQTPASLFVPSPPPAPPAPPDALFRPVEPTVTGIFPRSRTMDPPAPLPLPQPPTVPFPTEPAPIQPAGSGITQGPPAQLPKPGPQSPFVEIPTPPRAIPLPAIPPAVTRIPEVPAVPVPRVVDPPVTPAPIPPIPSTPRIQLPEPKPAPEPTSVPGAGVSTDPDKAKGMDTETLPNPRRVDEKKPEDPERPPMKLPDPREVPGTGIGPSHGVVPSGGPVLEPAPGLDTGETGVPSAGRVFGSHAITLSRDNAYRDIIGTDILTDTALSRFLGRDEANGPPSTRSFLQLEYLLWMANAPRIPALVTTGSTDINNGGALGQSGTQPLLGPGTFGPTWRDGFRIRLGHYLDECTGLGVDASYFFLGKRGETFAASSDQYPVLTRPIFDLNRNTESREVVAFPNISRGAIEVSTDSALWGADANIRYAVCRSCLGSHGFFGGYRYLNLTENLNIAEFITAEGTAATQPTGTRIVVRDSFRTENNFHGAQVGYFWTRRMGRLDLDFRSSVAIGDNFQIISVNGSQEVTRPGQATQLFRGGLLAAGPNLGRFTSNQFSVVPELTANVGFLVAPGVRAYAGYNFLAWTNVVRPGDQIDRGIDVTFVPNGPAGTTPTGQARPAIPFKQSDLTVHGLQFGIEFRW